MSSNCTARVTCRICEKTFPNLRLLGKHKKTWHQNPTSYTRSQENRRDAPDNRGQKRKLGNVVEDVSNSGLEFQASMSGSDNHNHPSNFPHLEESEANFPGLNQVSTYAINLCDAVNCFFKCFKDTSRELYPASQLKSVSARQIPTSLSPLFEHCMRNRMSRQAIYQEYELVLSLLERWHRLKRETTANDECGLLLELQNSFPTARSFANRVFLERKVLVAEQGWRLTVITNCFSNGQMGVFIPIMPAIQDAVREGGGFETAVGFRASINAAGERLFSRPQDSDAMRLEEEQAWRYTKTRVYFSLYCDGTMLAKSGAGNGTMIRLRVDNIPGLNKKWFDVGIAPVFDIGDETASDAVIREGRLELFHRFLYMILESATRTSAMADQYEFVACLLSLQADRPQEREFLSLMSSGCEQDCSICCCRTLDERKFQKARRELSSKMNNGLCGENIERLPVPPSGGHVSSESFEARNVVRTLHFQLEVAVNDRRTKGSTEEQNAFDNYTAPGVSILSKKDASLRKTWLHSQSVRRLPSALAVIDGIASPPLRLFSIAGLDLLHCLYLGPVRQFSDDAFKVFQRETFATTRPKARLVKAANLRIVDLPASSSCRGMRPFKGVESDKQASFTGKQRRDLLPYLWYAVLGLNEKQYPDKDPLFQVALQLDWLHAALCGVNQAVDRVSRSQREIEDLQERCCVACDAFIACFGAFETSKLHQLRVHLAAQLKLFGSFRFSDTGVNESLHKGVKRAYMSTNRRLKELGPQLLQVNVAAEVMESTLEGNAVSAVEHQLLLTRDPRVSKTANASPGDLFLSRLEQTRQAQLESRVAEEVSVVLNDNNWNSPSDAIQTVLAEADALRFRMFLRKKSVRISARFEWLTCDEAEVRQTLYATENFGNRGPRHDSARIEWNGSVYYGIVEAIIERRYTNSAKDLEGCCVAVIRKLTPTAAAYGNSSIVNEFGYERLRYSMKSGDVELVAVPLSYLSRRVVIVYDTFDLTSRCGYEKRVGEVEDTKEERTSARFFHAKNMKFTSLGEDILCAEELDDPMLSS